MCTFRRILQPGDLDKPARDPRYRDQAQPPALYPGESSGGQQRAQARAVNEGHTGEV
jgi:hypothetical protein